MSSRGGKRQGAGRPKRTGPPPTVSHSVRFTKDMIARVNLYPGDTFGDRLRAALCEAFEHRQDKSML